MARRLPIWQPSADQMAHWPEVSGNTINGVGEAAVRRPSPIYWHPPNATPHGPLQKWFYARTGAAGPELQAARADRQRAIDEPLVDIAKTSDDRIAAEWAAWVKTTALAEGADDVGITAMRDLYVYEHMTPPPYRTMIVLAVQHDYAAMESAPSTEALVEVTKQYARGTRVAKRLANELRARGHDAFPYGGPMAGTFLLVPAAIQAGLGELGKHGSMIHPRFGANFRLACVLTNLPLVEDAPRSFGADAFCTNCRVCMDACPPAAIAPTKQLVRGVERWYVDFDRCLPFFNENGGCALCLPACPFSRPEIGERLVDKLRARGAREHR